MHRAARVVTNLMIVLWLLGLAVWNLPDAPIRRSAFASVRTPLLAVGLEQNWVVFAPDPRRESRYVYAELTWADGKTTRWGFPRGGWWSQWRYYHWQKIAEALPSAEAARLRRVAAWIAGREARSRVAIATVRLAVRWRLSSGITREPPGLWAERDLLIWRPA
jgi:hypothetical protein